LKCFQTRGWAPEGCLKLNTFGLFIDRRPYLTGLFLLIIDFSMSAIQTRGGLVEMFARLFDQIPS
jgi:hypothetical protein